MAFIPFGSTQPVKDELPKRYSEIRIVDNDVKFDSIEIDSANLDNCVRPTFVTADVFTVPHASTKCLECRNERNDAPWILLYSYAIRAVHQSNPQWNLTIEEYVAKLLSHELGHVRGIPHDQFRRQFDSYKDNPH